MAQFFIGKGEENKLLVVSIFFVPVIVYFILWFIRVKKDVAAANFWQLFAPIWHLSFY
jgi:hypothetical protein